MRYEVCHTDVVVVMPLSLGLQSVSVQDTCDMMLVAHLTCGRSNLATSGTPFSPHRPTASTVPSFSVGGASDDHGAMVKNLRVVSSTVQRTEQPFGRQRLSPAVSSTQCGSSLATPPSTLPIVVIVTRPDSTITVSVFARAGTSKVPGSHSQIPVLTAASGAESHKPLILHSPAAAPARNPQSANGPSISADGSDWNPGDGAAAADIIAGGVEVDIYISGYSDGNGSWLSSISE
eukprot:m.338885 g.338885  ORF g.338885 m.338885 type:complete len:234 (-) comp27806_c0_seq1:58-759(-)